jgi:hypothetical protein
METDKQNGSQTERLLHHIYVLGIACGNCIAAAEFLNDGLREGILYDLAAVYYMPLLEFGQNSGFECLSKI